MEMPVKKILIFGPQGSGKGTQAELLSQALGSIHVSIGNMFRQEIFKKTPAGLKALEYTKAGTLVPDDIVNEIVSNRLKQIDVITKGFILEGYPRNKDQIVALEKIVDLTDVIVIHISDKEAIHRISGRLVCVCGKTYHIKYNQPKVAGICDQCQKKLQTREDDKPEAIQKRLDIYHEITEPLFAYYEKKNILHRINGEQSIPDVYKEIVSKLRIEKLLENYKQMMAGLVEFG